MINMIKKRGISPIIAMVLIIIMTLAGLSILFGIFKATIFDKFQNPECKQLDFFINSGSENTCYDSSKNSASIEINKGNNDINYSDIRFIFDFSGNTKKNIQPQTIERGYKKVFYFNLSAFNNLGKPNRISLSSKLNLGKKEKECEISSSSELKECEISNSYLLANSYSYDGWVCSQDSDCPYLSLGQKCIGGICKNSSFVYTCNCPNYYYELYQEKANEVQIIGDYYGDDPNKMLDGKWETGISSSILDGEADTTYYFNYSKKYSSINYHSPRLKLKYNNNVGYVAIPENCFIQEKIQLKLELYVNCGGNCGNFKLKCKDNKQDYLEIFNFSSSNSPYYFYEEAMIWNVSLNPLSGCLNGNLNTCSYNFWQIGECYQENANSYTIGDGGCGLNYSGRYYITGDWSGGTPSPLFDKNWSSFDYSNFNGIRSDPRLIFNYSVPANYISNPTLKIGIKNENGIKENFSFEISEDCLYNNSFNLDMKYSHCSFFQCGENTNIIQFYCQNTPDSEVIYEKRGVNGIYEEGMIWKFNESVLPWCYDPDWNVQNINPFENLEQSRWGDIGRTYSLFNLGDDIGRSIPPQNTLPIDKFCQGVFCFSNLISDKTYYSQVQDNFGFYGDYCKDNETLMEYSCENNKTKYSEFNCSSLFGTDYWGNVVGHGECQNGSCVLTGRCDNDCYPLGSKKCESNNIISVCTNADSDSCLEWLLNETCFNGGSCNNEQVECYLEGNCFDSDGGYNLSVYGNITDKFGNKEQDFCVYGSQNQIMEYFCLTNGSYNSNVSLCPNGEICLNGRCTSPPNLANCSDGDNGTNIYIQARTIINNSFSYDDSCVNNRIVQEFSCNSDKSLNISNISCPNGYVCSDGACSSVSCNSGCQVCYNYGGIILCGNLSYCGYIWHETQERFIDSVFLKNISNPGESLINSHFGFKCAQNCKVGTMSLFGGDYYFFRGYCRRTINIASLNFLQLSGTVGQGGDSGNPSNWEYWSYNSCMNLISFSENYIYLNLYACNFSENYGGFVKKTEATFARRAGDNCFYHQIAFTCIPSV